MEFSISDRWIAPAAALLMAAAFGNSVAQSPTDVVLEPVADTTLFEEDVLSNGAGDYLFAGVTARGARRRALVRFDFSDLPEGTDIVSARLELVVSRTLEPPLTTRLHRLMRAWGEGTVDAPGQEGTGAPAQPGDATWTHATLDGMAWDTAGGDFLPAESGRTVVRDFGPAQIAGDGLLEDIEYWRDHPGDNHGWIIIGNESAGLGNAKRFNSREFADPAQRVRLVLSATAPPPPAPSPVPVPALGGLGMALLTFVLFLVGRQRLAQRRR